ncbi:hypothetical protein K0M31_018342 [Melipona bicolor]|uniref:Uncharacterized protein n=1 Tax=Melipona bicolor TaxID=60889 RepID=A0AA40G392_9HYME|nr:hypothetical protein K0M31_018342 [Melipona bicolor]
MLEGWATVERRWRTVGWGWRKGGWRWRYGVEPGGRLAGAGLETWCLFGTIV